MGQTASSLCVGGGCLNQKWGCLFERQTTRREGPGIQRAAVRVWEKGKGCQEQEWESAEFEEIYAKKKHSFEERKMGATERT